MQKSRWRKKIHWESKTVDNNLRNFAADANVMNKPSAQMNFMIVTNSIIQNEEKKILYHKRSCVQSFDSQ